ncbi:uncharacterized mitochondrial protein atmg01250 [Phtheirospermum japonicum]|uniref:Uncharacterized mitochondrial protein atmg01250 n=1 Tax=Phtheirospermum japonicum TaxID=374723 RepID=A0A830BAB7_9LAMI|nr:uncharacterized mitochondrial protein atmg01250 [Phtheirospermum japonicum]
MFILCSKAFSCILQDLRQCGKIGGMKISKNVPCISHIHFADDTLLFGLATCEEVAHSRLAIRVYETASSQPIHLS